MTTNEALDLAISYLRDATTDPEAAEAAEILTTLFDDEAES